MRSYIVGLFFVLLLSFWAVRPLFSSGFFPMHDDTQVARVVAMGRALAEGQFPVRWVADLGYGYGYPIFNFYGPLPYYLGGVLYAAGISGLVATKVMFGVGILFAGLAMYLVVGSLLGVPAGILSALFYIYAPYHAVQVYIRGAVGEYWALIFFPLILWGLLVGKEKSRQGILVGSVGLAGVILSHTLLGYISTFFLIFFLAVFWIWKSINDKKIDWIPIKTHCSLILFGLGLSAFFWMPALVEARYTSVSGQIGGSADFHNHFVCFEQLWDSPWGFGGSAPGCIDGLSFRLGKVHTAMIALGMLIFFIFRKRKSSAWNVGVVGAGITFVSLFFLLPWSQFLWERLPGFTYMQYPWRFLALVSFGVALSAGASMVTITSYKIRTVLGLIAVVSVIGVNAKLFVPQYLYTKDPGEFEKEAELRFRASKISDEYLPLDLARPQAAGDIVHDTIVEGADLAVQVKSNTAISGTFLIKSAKAQSITIKRAFFPGWHFWVNKEEIVPSVSHGLPSVLVPKGESTITMRFTDTPIRILGNVVSIAACAGLILFEYTYGKKIHA